MSTHPRTKSLSLTHIVSPTDADEYRHIPSDEDAISRHPSSSGDALTVKASKTGNVQFWEQKWINTGKDVLSQVTCHGIEALKVKNKTSGAAGSTPDERLVAASKLLDTGRELLEAILDKSVGPDAVKSDMRALLTPLEDAVRGEMESKWEEIYAARIAHVKQTLRRKDVMPARARHEASEALSQARDIYIEGFTSQANARYLRDHAANEHDGSDSTVSATFSPAKRQSKLQVFRGRKDGWEKRP